MIGIAGDGAVRLLGAADAAMDRAARHSHPRGTLEQALPGEWVALVLTLVAIAVVGGAILLATHVGHGRMVARRQARRLARRESTRTMA